MSDKVLPHNDPDAQLARYIGSYLEGEHELNDIRDPLWSTLKEYKNQRRNISENPESGAIWEQISRKIPANKQTARIYSLENSKAIWAAAAAVLIAAFLGIYYYTAVQPQLIASSKQHIETVILDEGSKITLRPHSSLYALSNNADERNYRLEGEAWFEVVSLPGRTFSVKAGSGKVSVLGTKFDLSNWGGQTRVYLEEGSIRFENLKTEISVTLNPGESAAIKADNTIDTTRTLDENEFTDWLNKELIFNNKSVRYVFNELRQEFKLTITAPDSVLNTTLSGGLSLDNARQSLEDLSLVLDGKFIKTGNNSFKFVPNR